MTLLPYILSMIVDSCIEGKRLRRMLNYMHLKKRVKGMNGCLYVQASNLYNATAIIRCSALWRDSLYATVFSYCSAYTDDFLFALYIYIKRPFLYQMIESNIGNFFANSQSDKSEWCIFAHCR